MRLWHEYLIPYLDNKRLIGQHRECCALRGKGWGRKHSTVNYVFEHHASMLIQYHALVMNECRMRGFKIDEKWLDFKYRGKNMPTFTFEEMNVFVYFENLKCATLDKDLNYYSTNFIYPEHNPKYLLECLENLKSKNAQLINGKCIEELIIKLNLYGIF
jgi:uncharacterized protein (TIGR02328 family)